MLKIHFFNVAEGDSILLEYLEGKSPFRILIDTGRQFFPESKDSLRHRASEYLQAMDITYIDALVITHLHVDHIENLPEILKLVRVGSIYSTFFPSDFSFRIPPIKSENDGVSELGDDLNILAASLQIAEISETKLVLLKDDTYVPMENQYGSILLRLPMMNSLEGQNIVFDMLCRNKTIPEEILYWASESRNPNSLRLTIKYAGRTVILDGDYYACYAEKEVQEKCDILKVGHHGDRKSMTPKLAKMLSPKFAVISCKREYDLKKDRPSKFVADSLREVGAEVYYTDCFEEVGRTVAYHKEVLFIIEQDGTIIPPNN